MFMFALSLIGLGAFFSALSHKKPRQKEFDPHEEHRKDHGKDRRPV
mgnify:CR=1 FL=1